MFKDSDTFDAASQFLSTHQSSPSEVWIGLKWSTDTNTFYWIDGEELGAFSNWDTNEPNCMTNAEDTHSCSKKGLIYDQDCVRLKDLVWKTHGCSNTYYALCMGVVGSSLPPTSPQTTPDMTSSTVHQPSLASVSPMTTFPNSEPVTTSDVGGTVEETIEKYTNEMTSESFITQQISNTASKASCKVVCDPEPSASKANTEDEMRSDPPVKIDKKTTGAYIRARTSAYDGRLSAKILGLSGAAVICIVVLSVVLIDASRIFGDIGDE